MIENISFRGAKMENCQRPTLSMLPTPIPMKVTDEHCDFDCIKQRAVSKAMAFASSPELLRWYDAKRQVYAPNDKCCVEGEPNWLASALAKDADLAIDVNGEQYVFVFRKSGR
jgi:hypothetical protein